MKRRVVVTGVGAVSPIGNCVTEMWRNARNGVCGIDFIESFDTSDHKVKVAGEVKGFNPEDIMDKMQPEGRRDLFSWLWLQLMKPFRKAAWI